MGIKKHGIRKDRSAVKLGRFAADPRLNKLLRKASICLEQKQLEESYEYKKAAN